MYASKNIHESFYGSKIPINNHNYNSYSRNPKTVFLVKLRDEKTERFTKTN